MLESNFSPTNDPNIPYCNLTGPGYFIQKIIKFFDTFAPMKTRRVTHHPHKKHLTEGTVSLIRNRDSLYTRSSRLTTEIKTINTKIRKAVIADTRDELKRRINSTDVWRTLNKLHPKNQIDSNVFDGFSPDMINDVFVAYSTPTTSSTISTCTASLYIKPAHIIPDNKARFQFFLYQMILLLKHGKRPATTYPRMKITWVLAR